MAEQRAPIGSRTINITEAAANAAEMEAVKFIAYTIVLPLVCTFGIIGNICNLITLRSPTLQAVSYMYLRAMAVADLFCMVFVLPFILHQNKVIPATYPSAWYAAHPMIPLINCFVASGVLIVVALTIERYISVVWPTYFRQWNTPRRAGVAIFTAYVLSFLLYLPLCWKKRVHIIPDATLNGTSVGYKVEDYFAWSDTGVFIAYSWIRETILRIMPIISLAYFNIHIIIEFRRVRQRRAKLLPGYQTKSERKSGGVARGGPRPSTSSRDDGRLLVLLAAIVVLFFICNIPAAINTAIISDAKHNEDVGYQIFRAVANILEIGNHAVNFYMFCMCSKDYRNEFLKLFPCCQRLVLLRQLASTAQRSSPHRLLSEDATILNHNSAAVTFREHNGRPNRSSYGLDAGTTVDGSVPDEASESLLKNGASAANFCCKISRDSENNFTPDLTVISSERRESGGTRLSRSGSASPETYL